MSEHAECSEHTSDGTVVFIGIAIHIVGSIGINTGQNVQSMALQKHGLGEQPACAQLRKNKMWLIGTTLFVSFSIINFVALTLAPASILVPLESVQFVNNVIFGKFIRKVAIPFRMVVGVILMVLGTFLAVIFGPLESYCFSEATLRQKWTFTDGWGWWIWIVFSIVMSIASLYLHQKWARAKEAGQPIRNHQYLMPIAFAVPSALLGGAQYALTFLAAQT